MEQISTAEQRVCIRRFPFGAVATLSSRTRGDGTSSNAPKGKPRMQTLSHNPWLFLAGHRPGAPGCGLAGNKFLTEQRVRIRRFFEEPAPHTNSCTQFMVPFMATVLQIRNVTLRYWWLHLMLPKVTWPLLTTVDCSPPGTREQVATEGYPASFPPLPSQRVSLSFSPPAFVTGDRTAGKCEQPPTATGCEIFEYPQNGIDNPIRNLVICSMGEERENAQRIS